MGTPVEADWKAPAYCFECKRPLIEIDNRGQRLRGCMTCNIGDATPKMAPPEADAAHRTQSANS